jgi:dipeptide/tripeptide permease
MDIVIVAGLVISAATSAPVILQLRHHPRGLRILFFAEMWERFSYYGMRGLLIYFLTQHFLFDDKTASANYGAYTSLVYLVPVIGGVLADRFLGARKAVAFGALLLVAGHFTMAFEGPAATQVLTYKGATYDFQVTGRADARDVKLMVAGQPYAYGPAADGGLDIKGLPAAAPLPSHLAKPDYQISIAKQDPFFKNILYLALALIIVGVGFLKANISAIVGQLYPQSDPRRDSGFTLYYFGINLGSFLASITCGWLGQTIGWWAGFGAAGVGMALGWVVFVLGKPMLEGKGEPPDPVALAKPVAGPLSAEWLIYLGGLAGVGVIWAVVQSFAVVSWLLAIGAVCVLIYLAWYMITKAEKVERDRVILAVILILASVVFWALYEQGGSSLNLFAADLPGRRLSDADHGRDVRLAGGAVADDQARPAAVDLDPDGDLVPGHRRRPVRGGQDLPAHRLRHHRRPGARRGQGAGHLQPRLRDDRPLGPGGRRRHAGGLALAEDPGARGRRASRRRARAAHRGRRRGEGPDLTAQQLAHSRGEVLREVLDAPLGAVSFRRSCEGAGRRCAPDAPSAAPPWAGRSGCAAR